MSQELDFEPVLYVPVKAWERYHNEDGDKCAANAGEEGKDTAGMVAAASGQNRDAEKEEAASEQIMDAEKLPKRKSRRMIITAI